jgi:hypothetical protein
MCKYGRIREEKSAVKRAIVMALSVILALALAMPASLAQVGQGAKASGKAAELAALWWQWALSKPVEDNPLIGGDPNYSEEQCDGQPVTATKGKKWFLAGTFDGSTVERTCTMPVGTQLFFPVFNSIFIVTEPDETVEFARQEVNRFINSVLADPKLSIVVTVDGKEVKSKRIVRAESPVFNVFLPAGNIFGVPEGEYGPSFAEGLWVALPPLPPGEHTIHFEVSAPNVDLNPDKPGIEGFTQDNTYHLTVVKPNSRS